MLRGMWGRGCAEGDAELGPGILLIALPCLLPAFPGNAGISWALLLEARAEFPLRHRHWALPFLVMWVFQDILWVSFDLRAGMQPFLCSSWVRAPSSARGRIPGLWSFSGNPSMSWASLLEAGTEFPPSRAVPRALGIFLDVL